MKRIIAISAALISIALTGCGSTDNIDNIIDSKDESSPQGTSNSKLYEELGVVDSSNGEYDVDLTQLSSTMVYGQVYDMVYNPDNYVGQKIKASGPFSYYQDPETGNEYYAVLISDATACCSQGIEFVLNGDKKYPDDYPEIGDNITVTGDFNYYKEDMITYCQLKNAEILLT